MNLTLDDPILKWLYAENEFGYWHSTDNDSWFASRKMLLDGLILVLGAEEERAEGFQRALDAYKRRSEESDYPFAEQGYLLPPIKGWWPREEEFKKKKREEFERELAALKRWTNKEE